jgi:hypothetical protein
MRNLEARRRALRRRRSGQYALRASSSLQGASIGTKEEKSMNLVVWLPAMFALGLVSMGVCYAFVFACEEI